MLLLLLLKLLLCCVSFIFGLKELFYNCNPGDAPVKVESDREFALSPLPANFRCRSDRVLPIGESVRGCPRKSLLPAGSRVPKRVMSVQEQSGPGMQGSSSVCVQVVIMLAI